jgi:flavorubredoxin
LHVGIIYSVEKKVIENLADQLKRGLEEQRHTVFMYPADSDNFRGLAGCKYLFVGSYATSAFRPKTPRRLIEALGKVPGLAGKKSIAFIPSSLMGERKALIALMNHMEKQGCFMIDQRALGSEKEAYEFGRNYNLK